MKLRRGLHVITRQLNAVLVSSLRYLLRNSGGVLIDRPANGIVVVRQVDRGIPMKGCYLWEPSFVVAEFEVAKLQATGCRDDHDTGCGIDQALLT